MPSDPSPERPKCTEAVQTAYQRATQELIRSVPEFRGAVISLIWDLKARDMEHGLILGRDVATLPFLLQGCEQSVRTLQALIESTLEQLRLADAAAKELDELIASKQQRLRELEQQIRNASQ